MSAAGSTGFGAANTRNLRVRAPFVQKRPGTAAGSVRTTVVSCLVVIALVLAAFIYSTTRTPLLDDEALAARGVILLPKPRELSPFSLTANDGSVFDNSDLEGGWTFMFFGFTNCPDICPTTMSVLGQVDRQLHSRATDSPSRFRGVLVTVDPERDNRNKLGEYARAFSERFVGVTGERTDIGEFARELNVAFQITPLAGSSAAAGTQSVEGSAADLADTGMSGGTEQTLVQAGYNVDHTGNIVLINPYGHYHGFIKLPHERETIRLTYESLSARL